VTSSDIQEQEPKFLGTPHIPPYLIALLAIIIRIYILNSTHCTVEDSLITLRYAENLAHGHGLVYNLGERVQGATTPLFTLWMAFWSWLGVSGLAAGKALGVAADGTVCIVLARLMQNLGHPRAGWLAGLLYATASAPINFSVGGMETPIATLCVTSAISAFVLRRSKPLFVWLAIGILTRIDFGLLAVVLTADWALRERKLPSRDMALGFAILLPWFIFATLYFGSPIPNSMIAKLTVYRRDSANPFANVMVVWQQLAGDKAHLLLFAIACLGAVVAWKKQPLLRAPLIWVTIYYVALGISAAPVSGFGWYFVPPLPVLYLSTAQGFAWLWKALLANSLAQQRYRQTGIVFIMLVACLLCLNLRSTAASLRDAQRLEDDVRRPIGEWLAANTPKDATVLCEPIGYIGYYSQRRILDLAGLVSPEVLPIYRSGVENPTGWIARQFMPNYLVLRQSEINDVHEHDARSKAHPILGYYYQQVRLFPTNSQVPVFTIFKRVKSE
jgi:hypothetical protein